MNQTESGVPLVAKRGYIGTITTGNGVYASIFDLLSPKDQGVIDLTVYTDQKISQWDEGREVHVWVNPHERIENREINAVAVTPVNCFGNQY